VGIDDEIGETGAEVHDDAIPDVAARHPASRAAGDQCQLRLSRLAHESNDVVLVSGIATAAGRMR